MKCYRSYGHRAFLRRSRGGTVGGLLQETEKEALTPILHYKLSDVGPKQV